MRRKIYTVLLSVLMMVSFMPTTAFAGSIVDETAFSSFRYCRTIAYLEPVKTYDCASALDLSLLDKTISELNALEYDDSKTLDENKEVILGYINRLFSKYFDQYRAAQKLVLGELKNGESNEVVALVDNAIADIEALPFVYDKDNTFIEYLPPVELIVNNCKLNILNIKDSASIKAAKITQKKPVANKNGKIAVKISVKSVGDAKIAQYQIYRSTSKNFKKGLKKITVKILDPTQSTVTYTDSKGLKKGKKYYYKVRGVVDGKTYTKWSSVKNVKRK